MAITTEGGYITAKANAVMSPVNKASLANMAAGIQASLWRAAGLPVQATIPGAAAVVTRATSGAMFMPLVTGGNLRYIDALNFNGSVAGTVHILDRIIESGGLNGTLTTLQSVTTPTLPERAGDAGGRECEWWLEWYTDTGGTAVTATVNVTYDDASTGNVSVTLAATRRAGMMLPIISAVAGRSIRQVNSVTLSATTGAAGNFGVTCTRRLTLVGLISGANIADRSESLIRPVPTDACLMLQVDCTGATTGVVLGSVTMIEG